MNIAIEKKDQIVMSMAHYFITKENYSPVLVNGVKNEIWLQNLDARYKIIRINSNHIHNKEQFDFDILKVESILKQIKKKTLSFRISMLNIYVNNAEQVNLDHPKNIDCIEISDLDELKGKEEIQDAFPKIENNLIKNKNGLDLIYSVSNDINEKNEKENKLFEEIFKPKKIVVTYFIIAICILMFLLTYILGNGSNDTLTLLALGANYAPLVKAGEIFRLLSCSFLHAGIIHLIVNMYSLFIIGTQVENFIGKWKFIVIYLFSAISGSLMSIIFGTSISVGASGAIFGLLGALLYFGFHYRLYLGSALKSQIIPIIVLNLAVGFLSSTIDNGAHIGGLVGGYLIATALGVKGKTDKKEKINGLIVTILYLVLLSYIVFFVK